MQKIVYIYGLGYSGSTLLDVLLGIHPRLVGLGEIYTFFQVKKADFEKDECFCGRKLNDCEFWKDYSSHYEKLFYDRDYIQKYKNLIDIFNKKFKESVLVDSSKRMDVLNILVNNAKFLNIDLKILYLVRDVRGFSLSARKHRKEKKHFGNILLYQLGWWYRNWRFKRCLIGRNLNYLQVSHEAICFDTVKTLTDIYKYIGVDSKEGASFSLLDSKSHTVYGSKSKKLLKTTNAINYDYNWFGNFFANFFYVILPFVTFWNIKNVYKHKSLKK